MKVLHVLHKRRNSIFIFADNNVLKKIVRGNKRRRKYFIPLTQFLCPLKNRARTINQTMQFHRAVM